MNHPTRAAAFRQAVHRWRAIPANKPLAEAIKLGAAAIIEAEDAAARVRASTIARCRAAIGALAAGAPGDAQRILESAIAEAERGEL